MSDTRLFTPEMLQRVTMSDRAEAQAWAGYCPHCGFCDLRTEATLPRPGGAAIALKQCTNCTTLVLLGYEP